jgi:hypothetical protein
MAVCSRLRCGRRRSRLPRHGSLCQNRFWMCSSSVWHSTGQPFLGLKRRRHGLSSTKTQTTRQSFFVSTIRRLHSLDQLWNSVVYRCANFQCKSLRMKETSSCGFWGERLCHVLQLWFSVTRVLRQVLNASYCIRECLGQQFESLPSLAFELTMGISTTINWRFLLKISVKFNMLSINQCPWVSLRRFEGSWMILWSESVDAAATEIKTTKQTTIFSRVFRMLWQKMCVRYR